MTNPRDDSVCALKMRTKMFIVDPDDTHIIYFTCPLLMDENKTKCSASATEKTKDSQRQIVLEINFHFEPTEREKERERVREYSIHTYIDNAMHRRSKRIKTDE